VFGNVTLSSPRFYRCGCHPADSQTFSVSIRRRPQSG
jgi:hypothetical protein